MRLYFRLILTVLAAAIACAGPASAASKKAKQPEIVEPARQTCAGKDMLAEMKTAEPVLFAKIEQQAAAVENAEALLWRVEKPGLAPSHLFGTMHLTDLRTATITPKVDAAISGSQNVALEVADLSEAGTAAAIAEASRLAIFTDGRSLKTLLSREDYAKVEATLKRSGMPAEAGRLFKPWVISLLLASSDCERRKIEAGHPVLDLKIAEEAKRRSIPVTGLETAKEQFEAMASVPEDQQVAMLRAGLAYADRANDLVETLVQLYLSRKIGATWPFQVALAEKQGIPESAFQGFKDGLVTKRNLKMRDSAVPLLEKGGAFIAVGALHLSGKEGLVELFRQAGYSVTAME